MGTCVDATLERRQLVRAMPGNAVCLDEGTERQIGVLVVRVRNEVVSEGRTKAIAQLLPMNQDDGKKKKLIGKTMQTTFGSRQWSVNGSRSEDYRKGTGALRLGMGSKYLDKIRSYLETEITTRTLHALLK